MVSWGNLADRLEQWATSKYAVPMVRPEVEVSPGDEGGALGHWSISELEDLVETVDGTKVFRLTAQDDFREIYLKGLVPGSYSKFRAQLPSMSADTDVWMGVEGVAGAKWLAMFRLRDELQVSLQGVTFADITGSLPADYDTALNDYGIKVKRDRVEFLVNQSRVYTIETDPTADDRQGSLVGQQTFFVNDSAGLDVLLRGIWATSQGELSGAFETHQDYLWNNVSIAAGASSDPVLTYLHKDVTFYFVTDTSGDLDIEVEDPGGTWKVVDTLTSVPANELQAYVMDFQARRARLSFDTAATVTAWYAKRMMG